MTFYVIKDGASRQIFLDVSGAHELGISFIIILLLSRGMQVAREP